MKSTEVACPIIVNPTTVHYVVIEVPVHAETVIVGRGGLMEYCDKKFEEVINETTTEIVNEMTDRFHVRLGEMETELLKSLDRLAEIILPMGEQWKRDGSSSNGRAEFQRIAEAIRGDVAANLAPLRKVTDKIHEMHGELGAEVAQSVNSIAEIVGHSHEQLNRSDRIHEKHGELEADLRKSVASFAENVELMREQLKNIGSEVKESSGKQKLSEASVAVEKEAKVAFESATDACVGDDWDQRHAVHKPRRKSGRKAKAREMSTKPTKEEESEVSELDDATKEVMREALRRARAAAA